ncbi:MAG: carboxyltransferase domain-containing protein [Rhodobacteraceae bacterium]|nr:carboxyltransferase domain-containing protein [Paracoccaceae bacterium]
MSIEPARPDDFPVIRTVGLSGMLVTFADRLTEAANRATLAFRSVVEHSLVEGVIETSTSLASVYVRFDPSLVSHSTIQGWLEGLLTKQNWYGADLPEGRRLWRVPTVYGTDLAPQLAEAADAAGMSEAQAIDNLSATRVRVLTIGFGPGQPYLGTLDEMWDLPRQTGLTPQVPAGALVLAIRQLVLFSITTPTGWRHVGQTGFKLFQPGAAQPFALTAGDELQFDPVSKPDFLRLRDSDPDFGGATAQDILT